MLEHHEYRAVGEFEPQESVLITWPSTKYVYPGFDWETTAVEIVKELREVVKVYVQVDFRSPEEIAGILTAAGVPLDNIEFVKFTSDFIDMPKDQQEAYEMNYEVSYFRDYGAEVVMDDEGRRANVEFDQAWFMLDGANRYDRAAAIQTAAQRWHAELVGIDKHSPPCSRARAATVSSTVTVYSWGLNRLSATRAIRSSLGKKLSASIPACLT